MRRRILASIMTVTTFVVLLFAIPLGFVFARLANDRAVLSLEHGADLAARSIDLTSASDQPDSSEFPTGTDHFSLYTPTGSLRIGIGPHRLDDTVLRSGTNAPRTRRHDGNLVTVVPIVSGETTLGYLRASRSLDEVKGATRRAIALLIAGALAVLAVGWGLAIRIASHISASTNALRATAIELGRGNFTAQVRPVGIPELDDVGAALSRTARELDRLVVREQSFAADVSHQLRTPIAGMRAALETEVAFPRDERCTIIHETLADLSLLEQTVSDLLVLAKAQRVSTGVIDPLAIVTDAREHWVGAYSRKGRVLTVQTPTDSTGMCAYGQPQLLRQAIDALLDNALAHGEGTTTIALRSSYSGANDGDSATLAIAITDQGPGFPREGNGSVRSTMTTQTPARAHTLNVPHTPEAQPHGLGLSLAHRLLQAQGGRLVLPPPGRNPTVSILLRTPLESR